MTARKMVRHPVADWRWYASLLAVVAIATWILVGAQGLPAGWGATVATLLMLGWFFLTVWWRKKAIQSQQDADKGH